MEEWDSKPSPSTKYLREHRAGIIESYDVHVEPKTAGNADFIWEHASETFS